MDPAKRIGQAGKQAVGSVAGHYMDTLASTPYDRAMVAKHGDHDEGYFDDVKKDEPKVDAGLMNKHDTPNSPHSEHANASGGDPDELTQRRQRTRPEEAEPPEHLERENRQRSQRGFPQDEPPGPRPMTPYAAAQKLALDAEHARAKVMPRVFNNRGMNEGMEDEDAKLDNHKDSQGSTEHHSKEARVAADKKQGDAYGDRYAAHQHQKRIENITRRLAKYADNLERYPNHEQRPFWEDQIKTFQDKTGEDSDDGPAMRRAFQQHRQNMAMERSGLNRAAQEDSVTQNALALARAIHKAITYDVTKVGESHDPAKLTNKGKKGGGDASARPIFGDDYEGVREETDSIFQDAPDSETVTVTQPRFKRGPGPLAKAKAIERAVRRG